MTTLAFLDLIQQTVLERPIIAGPLALLLGLIAASLLSRGGNSKGASVAAIVGVLAGVGVFVLGTVITTDREIIRDRTKLFVDSFVSGDYETVEPMLSSRLALMSGQTTANEGKLWLLGVIAGVGDVITDNRMSVTDVNVDQNTATSFFRCVTSAQEFLAPVRSTWELKWQRTAIDNADSPGAEWRILQMRALTINGQAATDEWIGWGRRYITSTINKAIDDLLGED